MHLYPEKVTHAGATETTLINRTINEIYFYIALIITPSISMAKCFNQWKSVHKAYISLYKKLPLGVKPDTSLAATKIARIPLKDCYKKRGLGIYLKAVSSHKNKIGVLLPLSGQTTSYSNETLIGIQRFFRRKNLNYDDYVVLEDTRDLPRQLESKLAKLIFVDAVAMIVGGQTRKESKILSNWLLKLQIAYLSLVPATQSTNKQTFHVSPNPKLMADTLTKAMKSQKVKRLAIVSTTQRNSVFTEHVIASARKLGISVDHRVNYNLKTSLSEYSTKTFSDRKRETRR